MAIADTDGVRSHSMILSTAPDLCDSLQAMVQPMADAQATFQEFVTSNPDDALGQCEAERGLLADFSDPWFDDGLSTLSISLRDADELQEEPPPEGNFSVGL